MEAIKPYAAMYNTYTETLTVAVSDETEATGYKVLFLGLSNESQYCDSHKRSCFDCNMRYNVMPYEIDGITYQDLREPNRMYDAEVCCIYLKTKGREHDWEPIERSRSKEDVEKFFASIGIDSFNTRADFDGLPSFL